MDQFYWIFSRKIGVIPRIPSCLVQYLFVLIGCILVLLLIHPISNALPVPTPAASGGAQPAARCTARSRRPLYPEPWPRHRPRRASLEPRPSSPACQPTACGWQWIVVASENRKIGQ